MTPFPAVDALVALAGPGRRPPPPVDWPSVHRAAGSVLPVDYRKLVELTGSIRVSGFLGVHAPGARNPNVELLAQMGACLGALQALKRADGDDACPYPLWFEPGGLFPWGGSDNGDVLYWRTEGHPDQWTVVVGEARGPAFEEFPLPTSDFLLAFAEGRLECSIFPADAGGEPAVVQNLDDPGPPS